MGDFRRGECIEIPVGEISSGFKMSLFNFFTGFMTGVYAGLYAAKHYQVPDVPEPKTIYENVVKFIDGYKKEDSDNKKD